MAVASTIPFLAVWYLTSPMVVWIHMRVPDKYRRSKHVLNLFLDAPPADAEVTITNMGAVFKPRISHVRISDLRPERRRFGLVNYTRDTAKENAQRKWWMFRAMGGFRIEDETTTGSKTKWAWEAVARQIRRGSIRGRGGCNLRATGISHQVGSAEKIGGFIYRRLWTSTVHAQVSHSMAVNGREVERRRKS